MAIEPYYKILTTTDGSEATILLYGPIGPVYDWKTDQMVGTTDIEFAQELGDLANKYSVINIRLNSPGGDFLHGNAIMTAIQNCKAEVRTWNDGICASMAADIWLCAKNRGMAKNALLMIHPAWSFCVGHSGDMMAMASQLDKITEAAITATAASCGMTEEEMRQKYYADKQDHWLNYNDATADNLITITEDYNSADIPTDAASMSMKQVLDHFQKKNNPEGEGLTKRVMDLFRQKLMGAAPSNKLLINEPKTDDMTLEEIKKGLEDGSLNPAAVQALLTPPPPEAAPAEAPPDTTENIALKALQTALDAQAAQMKTMQETLDAYGKMPGAGKSLPGAPPQDLPPAQPSVPDELMEFNKNLAMAASKNDVVNFTK